MSYYVQFDESGDGTVLLATEDYDEAIVFAEQTSGNVAITHDVNMYGRPMVALIATYCDGNNTTLEWLLEELS